MRFFLFKLTFALTITCGAQANLGNMTAIETNNNGIICYGEDFSFNVLGNVTMPSNLNLPGVNYNPGVGIALFANSPTYTNNELLNDPNFIGIIQTQPDNIFIAPFVFDYNTLFGLLPPPFNILNSPTTLFFQAVTLYDYTVSLPYVNVVGSPIDAAQSNPVSLTFQPEIILTVNQDCNNQWVEFTPAQMGMGNPNFDIINTYPISCTFANSVINQVSSTITGFSGNNIPFGFEVVNADGCSATYSDNYIGTFTANIDPVPSLCENEMPINLAATPAGGVWSGNNAVLSGNTFDPSGININSATDYVISYTPITPIGGCAITSQITITVNPSSNSQFTAPTELCINNDPVSLQVNTTGGVWSAPNNCINTNGLFDPSICGSGVQTVLYAVNGACPSFTSHDIVVYDLPTISFTASTNDGCLPLIVNFQNTTPGINSNFAWFVNGQMVSNGSDNVSYTFTESFCQNIGLSLTDNNGCSNQLDSANVVCPFPDPIIDFTFDPINPTLADFEISFNETLGNTSTNYWEFGDGLSSFDWAPTHFYETQVPSEYEVCLTGFDINGCESKMCKYLNIESGFEIFCPTAFTPGDDGLNDGFRPVFVSKKEIFKYQMRIFNRYGEKIFDSTDIKQAWYGNNDKGDMYVPDGSYTWIIDVTLEGLSERQTFKGSVLIVR